MVFCTFTDREKNNREEKNGLPQKEPFVSISDQK